MGQQALAGVIKAMMNNQHQHQQQPQTDTGSGPTVTEVDDDNGDVLNFTGGPSPQTGPPDIGSLRMTIKPPRPPKSKEGRKQN